MNTESKETEKQCTIHDVVKRKSEELNDDLKKILGRPNFACGKIASRLREKGFECETKAESEQALVIHTMLTFYDEFGANVAYEMEKQETR